MSGEPILVVDDSRINLKLARVLLETEGYEVRPSGSAAAGSGRATQSPREARAAGCDGYIAKPIDTRSLAETIAAHLDSSGGKGST